MLTPSSSTLLILYARLDLRAKCGGIDIYIFLCAMPTMPAAPHGKDDDGQILLSAQRGSSPLMTYAG